MSVRVPMALRIKPSAIGLRQVFPVQTKSTCLGDGIAREHARIGAGRQMAMGKQERIESEWSAFHVVI